jgi:hypothetical protein
VARDPHPNFVEVPFASGGVAKWLLNAVCCLPDIATGEQFLLGHGDLESPWEAFRTLTKS